MAHVAAAAVLAGTLLLGFAAGEALGRGGAAWWVEDLRRTVSMAVPGLVLLPAYRRVSFRRRDVLFFALVPFWGWVIAWKVGYRLAALPYRDRVPRSEEYPFCRRVPGTSYHVVVDEASTPETPAPRPA